MEENERIRLLEAKTLQLGAFRTKVIEASAVETDASFRDMCARNACGMWGKCWTCPPDIGQIDVLMAELQQYSHVLVYQTVGQLEDSYDFEGMTEAGKHHNRVAQSLRTVFAEAGISDPLHLGAGGCRVCPVCARRTGEPCRHPEKMHPCVESHGINVIPVLEEQGLQFQFGENVVTWISLLFY